MNSRLLCSIGRRSLLRSHATYIYWCLSSAFFLAVPDVQFAKCEDPLPNTQLLTETRPLDVVMVEGIDRFALRAIEEAKTDRIAKWNQDVFLTENPIQSLKQKRIEFSKIIGCIDPRVPNGGIQTIATIDQTALVSANDYFEIYQVRWSVLQGVDAEGYFLKPKRDPIARVVAIPDADWTPEQICGLMESPTRFAADLAVMGCEVLVPTIVSRGNQFSENPSINRTANLTHREFIYRQAFEVGRHIIGYEVQKVLAAVDAFTFRNQKHRDVPIGVCGVSEGGLLAFYSAAIDPRIDAALVSGYFSEREGVWNEPIYRNVWRLLDDFGDAQIAAMIAPRHLMIEVNPEIPIPAPLPESGRRIAAPGQITQPNIDDVLAEVKLAEAAWEALAEFTASQSESPSGGLVAKTLPSFSRRPISSQIAMEFLNQLTGKTHKNTFPPDYQIEPKIDTVLIAERQSRTISQMTSFTQRTLQLSHRVRDAKWNPLDRRSVDQWIKSAEGMREWVHRELIGRLPTPTLAARPRTRRVISEENYDGYEVVLDVYPDVIASGILLLPKDIEQGEKRPVVVCQHGLEGTPMDTIIGSESRAFQAYKAFSVQLVKQGYIVYAPQNPYRGQDAFRTLQRKSNPLGRTLFSYIIPQHLVSLRWLCSLPQVDRDRIGFYGLSYGGKTAVRVPPLLPPTEKEPGYSLSICSADFNEWVSKNASTDVPFSYIWTPEYEIFEWDMANIANYAELSMLMAPRPFMVERGHNDGVGIDEWVAWEFAKVRRHYAQLNQPDRTEIEFFDGPHTINGAGTFQFLDRHLKQRSARE
jgi:cephalosporin-C deacetylase-like acetyl esterase